jgi:pilus assembly protein CpaB
LVAAHQLRAGTFLRPEDVKAQEFIAADVPSGASADNPAARAKLQGAMLRHSVGEGQVLVSDDVLRPGDHGFLAAVLEPGMRAVTLGPNELVSDWALIWPGDRVDLILTQQFEDPATFARRRIAAETVITDARVVAVDKQLMQGEMADDAERKGVRTLTVEVSPEGAERLAVALRLGKLGIALRAASPAPGEVAAQGLPSPATPVAVPSWAQLGAQLGTRATAMAANAATPPYEAPEASGTSLPDPAAPVTWSGDVSHALNQPTRPPEPQVLHLFRGSDDGKDFKF